VGRARLGVASWRREGAEAPWLAFNALCFSLCLCEFGSDVQVPVKGGHARAIPSNPSPLPAPSSSSSSSGTSSKDGGGARRARNPTHYPRLDPAVIVAATCEVACGPSNTSIAQMRRCIARCVCVECTHVCLFDSTGQPRRQRQA
jgi:hypothetical protein